MEFKKGQREEAIIVTNSKGMGTLRVQTYKGAPLSIKESKQVEKIEVQNEFLNLSLPGDRVSFEIIDKNRFGLQAKVLEILERKQENYGGHIEQDGKNFFFVSHDTKMYTDFYVAEQYLNGAKNGDKVIVKIVEWKNQKDLPKANVYKVLGKKGDSRAEIASYSEERGFDVGFNADVEKESQDIHIRGITEDDTKDREDFRGVTTFTIDPYDAKDFDDAISFKKLDNGNFEIGVHIADVTHFMKVGGAMDTEARRRTTSVYLVDRVVPMLPEVLSNDLCSLVEGKDRLTMAAIFEIDKNATLLNTRIRNTVINSTKRFTYEQAQEIIVAEDESVKFGYEVITLNKLAKQFEKRRKENGALTLETEEVKFKLDENYVPIEVYRKVRFDAHKLVEEFMLLANVEVAKYISKLGEKNHVGVYRIHDAPDSDKMLALSIFLYNLGYDAPFKDDTISPHDLNKIMSQIGDDPNKTTIQNQIIRSQQKAVYSTQNTGHYGLAFSHYTHFTSPIRRYPDDMVHRLLKRYLKGETTGPQEVNEHEVMCLRSSQKEKDAADAERSSIKYKQVEYMSYHLGETVTAVISGLSQFGVYFEDEYSKCEGMIRFKELGSEFFEFDENAYIVEGDQGTIFKMGDVYKVKVASTDLEKGHINYEIIEKVRSLEPKKLEKRA